jgi:hypothetical protein
MYYICLMSDVAPTSSSVSAQLGSHYGPAIDNLRSTVKWLVASAGAVIAVILTGAQLVDYSRLNIVGAAVAAAAVVVGLGVTVTLLLHCAQILTIPRPTATELANDEFDAGVDPASLATGSVTPPPRVAWILDRTTYLLGAYPTVRELLLAYGRAGKRFSAAASGSDEARDAQALLLDLRERIGTVEEAAHYRDVLNDYTSLMAKFRKWAKLFVGAVIAFSLSGLLRHTDHDKPTNPVTQPYPVRVIAKASTKLVQPACRDRPGVAVGGTFSAPTVVLPPTPDCEAETFTAQEPGYVVVPQLTTPHAPEQLTMVFGDPEGPSVILAPCSDDPGGKGLCRQPR